MLREVESRDLALALKGASGDVRNRILKNTVDRAAQTLSEDIEALGPVRVRSVEEAQQRSSRWSDASTSRGNYG